MVKFPLFVPVVVLVVSVYLGYVYRIEDNHVTVLLRQSVLPLDSDTPYYNIVTYYFNSNRLKCEAFFYKPKGVENPPVIVMAPGLGAQKDFALDKFADVFARNNYAVFLFDYRTFGGSEGEPMNLVSPTAHLEDWESALDFVSTMEGVNSENIALWGSSLSGGHVLVTAAKSHHKQRIKAVIAQVPFVRAFSSVWALASTSSLSSMAKLSFFGLVDKTREWLGLSRYYIPIYGNASDLAMLSSPSSSEYKTIVPENPRGGWQNKCPASIALSIALYNPHTFASDVVSPTLIVYDTQDDLCPFEDIKDLTKIMQNLTLKEYSISHFAPYVQNFLETVNVQLDFLKKNLPINS